MRFNGRGARLPHAPARPLVPAPPLGAVNSRAPRLPLDLAGFGSGLLAPFLDRAMWIHGLGAASYRLMAACEQRE